MLNFKHILLGLIIFSTGQANAHILFDAARTGNVTVVQQFIKTDQEVTDAERYVNYLIADRVLWIALKSGQMSVVMFLLQQVLVDVNLQNPYNYKSPLMPACQYGNFEMIQYLISRGALVNLPDKEGMTTLMLAVENHHLHIVHFLLNHGADTTLVNSKGQTALGLAAENNFLAIFSCLAHSKNISQVELIKVLTEYPKMNFLYAKQNKTLVNNFQSNKDQTNGLLDLLD
ncbi:ankyrin repeat domain-containing protein [bacterium]|jgi:ankyrin repeat protein|nr:ankyrin repeat domain-containing protein [bacterium]MBT5015517.1 ankyrin repeat domain-containing protein [bacterium]